MEKNNMPAMKTLKEYIEEKKKKAAINEDQNAQPQQVPNNSSTASSSTNTPPTTDLPSAEKALNTASVEGNDKKVDELTFNDLDPSQESIKKTLNSIGTTLIKIITDQLKGQNWKNNIETYFDSEDIKQQYLKAIDAAMERNGKAVIANLTNLGIEVDNTFNKLSKI
jgi:hypothetical protein